MRIARIHALEASIGPIREAFADGWPKADGFDLLDTALAPDRAAGVSDASIAERIQVLADYAARLAAAQGILFTCSAFGDDIRAAAATAAIPVLTPNEAAFEDALSGARRVGLLVTFAPSRDSLTAELMACAQRLGHPVEVTALLVPGALERLAAGDAEGHDHLIAAAATGLLDAEVVILGQYSMARAADAVRKTVDARVVTTPDAAVRKLRRLVEGRDAADRP